MGGQDCEDCKNRPICIVYKQILIGKSDEMLKDITCSPDDYADARAKIKTGIATNCSFYSIN